MVHNQVSAPLLNEFYDHIFDLKKEYLGLSLREHQENRGIFKIQYFLD